jgi:Gas vesicle protein G
MDLLTLLFRLPFLPLRGFVQLAEILHDQAEQELRDPASVRRQLEEAQEAHVSGELSDEDLAHVEGQAVGRLLSSPTDTSASSSAPGNGR